MTLTLINIDSTHRLDAPSAASYRVQLADGCPSGCINSAARTYAEQKVLYDLFKAGKGNPADRPGTSKHEIGICLDLAEPARSWFAAHSAAHGWTRPYVKEPWHFEYHGNGAPKGAYYTGALGSRTIWVRNQGDDVKDLQRRLNALPTALPLLAEDSDYYTASTARVVEFQGQHGLGADGVPGPATIAALIAAEPPAPTPEPVPIPEPDPIPVPTPEPEPVPEPTPTPDPIPDPIDPPDDTPLTPPDEPAPVPTKAPNWLVEFVRIILDALARFFKPTN